MKKDISPPNNLGILDNRYILLKKLGMGATSIVYKVNDLTNNREYACKLFHKYDNIIENEIKMNKKINTLNSPFFIKYIYSAVGCLVKDGVSTFYPYIILELCSKKSPCDYIIDKHEGLEEKMCKLFFSKILQIVQCLHRGGICHRDLKLDNFLLDGDKYNIKLGDFGFSSLIIKKNGKAKKQNGKYGTPNYEAPEIILNKSYDGEKADIFSLGVILFSLRTRKFGFDQAKVDYFTTDLRKKLYNYIKEKKIETYWKILENNFSVIGLSEEFKNLYIKMVSFNPKERPTIEEIYNDKWLKEIRDLNEEELKAYEKELIDEFKKIEEEKIKI